MSIKTFMQTGPVIPVVIIDDADDAVPLADALVEGGIHTIEVTLRSPAALDCIAAIAQNRPEVIVGAGTVLNPTQLKAAQDAGARFAVSPGAYPELLEAVDDRVMPLLPGAATASEMMQLMAHGLHAMKFFPASVAGGPAYLKALASPLASAMFCPTGGITEDTAKDWLSLPNVLCVGGSWVAPTNVIKAQDFDSITAKAKSCDGLAAS
jgi:2-dehydro-3-deoxyphosphogluconate aldolase/(4S)-4-hydroxy-2-oxoglutarate aldolase